MKKTYLLAALAFILISCGGQTNCGTTITQVNKCMPVFDSVTGKAVIFSATGEGQIENIYLCGDDGNWRNPEQCVLNIYCDDQLCVSGKFYEMACIKPDYLEKNEYRSLSLETPLFSKFGARNSINLNFKIPYYRSCKVELVQPGGNKIDHVWTTVRANTKIDIAYGGRKLPKGTYFKALRAGDQTIESGDQFTMMETDKHSMVIGLNLFVDSKTNTSMEACLRAIDLQSGKATLLSSGLEDFFLGTYYFDAGPFKGFYDGLTCFKPENGGIKLAAYRVLTDNPLCFENPVRITVRNGENNEIDSDSPITDNIYLGRGIASYGAFCFYYEW